MEATLGRKELDEVALDEAAADLELVSDAHQQVLASQKEEKKADKKETTKEEKKTLKVENHNLAQQVSPQA